MGRIKSTTERFDAFDASGRRYALVYTKKSIEVRPGYFDETFGELITEDGEPVNVTGEGEYELVVRKIKLTSTAPNRA
jgi:hypothetical protein